jgi:hypothetical protein
MRKFIVALLLTLMLLVPTAITSVQDTSAHTYKVYQYSYCWKFVSGIYYLRDVYRVYYDVPFGGHRYYTTEYQYGQCYIS